MVVGRGVGLRVEGCGSRGLYEGNRKAPRCIVEGEILLTILTRKQQQKNTTDLTQACGR